MRTCRLGRSRTLRGISLSVTQERIGIVSLSLAGGARLAARQARVIIVFGIAAELPI